MVAHDGARYWIPMAMTCTHARLADHLSDYPHVVGEGMNHNLHVLNSIALQREEQP